MREFIEERFKKKERKHDLDQGRKVRNHDLDHAIEQ